MIVTQKKNQKIIFKFENLMIFVDERGAVMKMKSDLNKTKLLKDNIEKTLAEKSAKQIKKKRKFFKRKKFGQKQEKSS